MKRYVDFSEEGWALRTDSRMQATRWAACMDGLGDDPPFAGVLDHYPDDLLLELVETGWLWPAEDALRGEGTGDDLRDALRRLVMASLAEDAGCLSSQEHQLVERLLIQGGTTALDSLEQLEAAYTLRMRLWCDAGMDGDTPLCRMDPLLLEALPPLLMQAGHLQMRQRSFVFEGLIHALLYINGYLPEEAVQERYIEQVLDTPLSPQTLRLARNYIEASFDTYETSGGLNLIVHSALADPEAVEAALVGMAETQIEISSEDLAASMNGLLPEEAIPNEAMQRALGGALRPEYAPDEAAGDLRYLAKQDAPLADMRDVMAGMLVVLPTEHMDSALAQLRQHAPRWLHAQPRPGGAAPSLH